VCHGLYPSSPFSPAESHTDRIIVILRLFWMPRRAVSRDLSPAFCITPAVKTRNNHYQSPPHRRYTINTTMESWKAPWTPLSLAFRIPMRPIRSLSGASESISR